MATKVVTIGGGTGTFVVLSGLKKYKDVELTAIVAMTDNGGSTGRLRDEYGVLPPGDLRQCLVALSEAPQYLRTLFNHRYDRGGLEGHTFGNLFLSTLEQTTGSLDKALIVAGDILKICGSVVPVTLEKAHLITELKNGKLLEGEHALSNYQLVSRFGVKRIYLKPKARANPKALRALAEADVIIVGPGNFYSSLVPNFLVKGIPEAIRAAKAKRILVANIMNKHGQTDDFTVESYLNKLEFIAGGACFDVVLYNSKRPAAALLKKYADEGEPVRAESTRARARSLVGKNLLADGTYKAPKGDALPRTLIRHDPDRLAKAVRALF